MESSVKRRAVASEDGSIVAEDTQVVVDLPDHRRKQLMAQMNIVEHMPDEPEPEFSLEHAGEKYSEEEDLLNIEIAPKYEDLVVIKDGCRMVIKSIYVENFKSYKGRHQLGPLHKNLTMVVGPNGSGKSNVIDSLLFVFGFRARKIRTQKLTSLIYNNDDDADHCLVEIQFHEIKDLDNDKYQVNNRNCFNIGRSVHLNGTSQYFFNGAVSSQKEVQDILMKVGIDMTHNRFLILQGEVEAISLMKPTSNGNPNEEGMLEYIEDIVGTNRYVVPTAKLAHRVKILEIKVSHLAALCRRHQTSLDAFNEVLNGGIAYVNARNNANLCEGLLNKHALATAKATKEAAENSYALRQTEVEEKKKTMNEAREYLRNMEKEEKEVVEQLKRLESLRNNYATQLADWHQQDRTMHHVQKNAVRALKDTTKEMQSVTAEIEQLSSAPEVYKVKIDNMNQELEQLLNQKVRLDKNYTATIAKYDQRVSAEREALARMNEIIDNQSRELIISQAELAEAESELKDMHVTNLADQRTVEELRKELEQCYKNIEDDNNFLPMHRNDSAAYNIRISEARTRLDGYKGSLTLLRAQRYEHEREMDELNMFTKKVAHHKQSLVALHELHRKGQFPGFVGRLGDMAYVDKKFDAAISTVFGNALELVIVKTKEDAMYGIDFLTAKQLPRAHFFFMDYCRDMNWRGLNANKDNYPAPRLFDQIQFDNQDARKCFYKTMGDILIVATIAEAVRVDKKHRGKFRYATYDGTFIDHSGTISGGGKPATGRIRTSKKAIVSYTAKHEEMDKVKVAIERVTAEIDRAEDMIQTEHATIAECEPHYAFHSNNIARLEGQIERNSQRAATLEAAIPDAERLAARRPTRIITQEEVDQKLAEVTELRQKVQQQAAEIERGKQERDEKDKRIGTMFEGIVGKNKEELRTTTNSIQNLEAEIAKERVVLDNLPAHQASLHARLKELDREMALRQEESDKASDEALDPKRNEEFDELTTKSAAIKAELDERNKEYEECSAAKLSADADYQQACSNYRFFDDCMEETRRQHELLEEAIFKCEKVMEKVESSWCEPEDLDPHTKFVRVTDPNFQRKLLEDFAVVLPEEVLTAIDKKYQQEYDETETHIMSGPRVAELQSQKRNLERNQEMFRKQCDSKGITDFASLVCLQMNELTQYNKAAQSLKAHRTKLLQLRHARLTEFSEALTFLETTTQMLYQLITNGGDASLKFVEEGRSDDPFVGGIKFSVRPAKKSWKLIENLSGGEKTLASLCFVFAMHHFRPTPLYVMDEIDAALDLNNVRLIANYIKTSERTRNAQFIIISLRNQMFEVGSRLVGIYKTNGSTKHIMINPDAIEKSTAKPQAMIGAELKKMARLARGLSAEEEELTEEMSKVTIQPKIQRKLGQLNLRDFIGRDDSVVPDYHRDSSQERDASLERDTLELDSPLLTPPRQLSDDEFYEEDERRQIKKKPKKRVDPEFDDEEEEEEEEEEVEIQTKLNKKKPKRRVERKFDSDEDDDDSEEELKQRRKSSKKNKKKRADSDDEEDPSTQFTSNPPSTEPSSSSSAAPKEDKKSKTKGPKHGLSRRDGPNLEFASTKNRRGFSFSKPEKTSKSKTTLKPRSRR